MQTSVFLRQLAVLVTGLLLSACFPQAYSPSLDLGYDQLRRGRVRLGAGVEMAPHGESAAEGTVGVLPAVLVQSAFGVTANTELHLKLQSNVFNGVGGVLSGNIRVSHGQKHDLLLMPRIGASSILGIEAGFGGGGAAVLRLRSSPKMATWVGLGYYHGGYNGVTSSGFGDFESGRFSGGAAVLHLGGSRKVSEGTQLNFEFSPMVQYDDYHNRSAFVPAAKFGISFDLNERRYQEAERARKME